MGRRAAAILFAVTIVACSDAAGPTQELAVRVAETSIAWVGTDALISFSVTNTTARTHHVSRCGSQLTVLVHERVAAGAVVQWREVRAGYCTANQPMSPVPLQPGEVTYSAVRIQREGTYRIATVSTSPSADDLIERALLSRSQVFVVPSR